MKINVKFFASCRDIVGADEIEIELDEKGTVGDLWHHIAYRFPKLSDLKGNLFVALNKEYTDFEAQLNDKDEVAFIPPVSGG